MRSVSAEPQELRNVVSFEKGKPPAQQPYFGRDAELYLTPEYLRGGGISEPIKASSNAIRISDGDTIVLWDGSNAGEVFKGRSGILSSTMTRLKHCDSFDREYFFYAVKRWEPFLKGQTSGSGIPHVDKEVLGKLAVLNFVRPEQTKISEILSTVDRAIEQTEAFIAKQQHIKTGLMQDLLSRGIDEHGNLRSQQSHPFKDSPLGRIPVEWEVKRLRECSEVCNNFRKPISALVREKMKGDYPYYGPTGVLDYINEYRIDGRFVLIGEDGDHFLKFKNQEMTLLIDGKWNVNNHAHILRGKGDVKTEWLHLFFLHRDITLNLTRQGAGRFKLNKAALLELLLSVPEMPEEQDRILKVMNTLRQHQSSSIECLNKLKLEKIALMQDLLTGEKRVTPLLQAEIPIKRETYVKH